MGLFCPPRPSPSSRDQGQTFCVHLCWSTWNWSTCASPPGLVHLVLVHLYWSTCAGPPVLVHLVLVHLCWSTYAGPPVLIHLCWSIWYCVWCTQHTSPNCPTVHDRILSWMWSFLNYNARSLPPTHTPARLSLLSVVFDKVIPPPAPCPHPPSL